MSFIRHFIFLCALYLMGTSQAIASSYTIDELLPDPYSAFVPLRAGQFNISNSHFDPRTGTVGIHFPSSWDYLPVGSSIRLKVLVPPGVNLVTWRVEAPSLVAFFGACDEQGVVCADESYTPTLWPVGYNGQSPTATPVDQLPAVAAPKIVYLTVKTTSIDFVFFSMTVNYNVSNPALYEAWRQARSWAGGSGDCDGLGGLYCNGSVQPGTGSTTTTTSTTPSTNTSTTPNTATFTLASMYDTVRSGEMYALVSTLPVTQCTATSTAFAPASNPAIASSGFLITGMAPSLSASESTAVLIIQCKAASGSSATKVLMIEPDPRTLTNAYSLAQSGANNSAILSIKFTPGIYEVNQSTSFFVGAEVRMPGQEPQFLLKNERGAWVPFVPTDSLADKATVKSVPYSSNGVTVPVLNGELRYAELLDLKAMIYIAYQITGQPLQIRALPIFDCSGSACVGN